MGGGNVGIVGETIFLDWFVHTQYTCDFKRIWEETGKFGSVATLVGETVQMSGGDEFGGGGCTKQNTYPPPYRKFAGEGISSNVPSKTSIYL